MITTALTRLLNIDHPIIQAGMASDCGAELASAVSNAGALGSIGSIGRSPDDLADQIRRTYAATIRPFAVNIVTWDWSPIAGQFLNVAIAERAPVITLSFGDCLPALERCKAAGIPTMVQVQDFERAKAVLFAYPAAIIVQGNESGGHTGWRGTLSFAAQVLEIAGDIPVVIAGGIANGRGLAAAIAMGAAGVVMGTRFKATPEFGGQNSLHVEAQKAQIATSDGSNTIYSRINDIAIKMDWPNGVTGRTITNRFHEQWLGREAELLIAVTAEPGPAFTIKNNRDPDTFLNWAGESAGLVHEILPAAEIVRRTVAEAETRLRNVTRSLA
jgi:nitronate monooxygenase